jgi:hypothetical protein
VETFEFSTDPHLDAKVRDVVGLYLDPPANAVVVCADEKSQIQALDRTAPLLPIRRGTFTSVPDLIGAIHMFIDAYNKRCEPFTWSKTADQILAKAHR